MRLPSVLALALAGLVMTAAGAHAERVRLKLRDSCKKSGLVFSGTVTGIKSFSGARFIIDFDVDQVWKGPVKRTTRIYYINDGNIEATQFFVGRRYLICAPKWGLWDFNDPRREPVDVPVPGVDWGFDFDSVKSEVHTLGTARRP